VADLMVDDTDALEGAAVLQIDSLTIEE
jgi:hypothetical protein